MYHPDTADLSSVIDIDSPGSDVTTPPRPEPVTSDPGADRKSHPNQSLSIIMIGKNSHRGSVYGHPHLTMDVIVPEYPEGLHEVEYIWIHGFRIDRRPSDNGDNVVGNLNPKLVTLIGDRTEVINGDAFVVDTRRDGTATVSSSLLNDADFIGPNVYRPIAIGERRPFPIDTIGLITAVIGTLPEPTRIQDAIRQTVLNHGWSRMLPLYYDQFLWLKPVAPQESTGI
jgi:hypothetical protein